MEEFKGTPGPWSWNGEDYRGDWGWQILVGPIGQGIVIGEAPEGIYKGLKAHQDVAAHLCKTGYLSPDDGAPGVHVRYHNAQLIAAAPELLEALQFLFDDYKELADSGDAGNWRVEDKPAGKKALQAIAKALGKE